MSSLLDTCTVLWAAREPGRLPRRVRDRLLDAREEVLISVGSAWEIAIKPELGIADAAAWVRTAADNLKARVLPVRLEHIGVLQRLPAHHRDPFDRLLLAQAIAGELALLTPDEAMQKYEQVECVWD